MKKVSILSICLFLALFSCSTDELTNPTDSLKDSDNNRVQAPSSECAVFFTVDLSDNYYTVVGHDPLIEFTWDFSQALLACNTSAYIEISDEVNGGANSQGTGACSYEFFSSSFPINMNSLSPLTLNINFLTAGPPHLVLNSNSPTGFNEIYGSKCFFWRLVVTGDECNSTGATCETTTAWEHFEWTI